jgi:GT2 family glycosyltransferase
LNAQSGSEPRDQPRPHVVVVLSWHGKDDTLHCLRSILPGTVDASVLVIDNGSFDGTLEAVRTEWPDVFTLQTGQNLGFSGGMNAGIAWALDHGAEFVTILNNDTVVTPDALDALRDIAREGVAVSPMVMYRDAPDKVWFGGGSIDRRLGFPHHIAPADLAPPVGGRRSSTVLAGCCITASSAVWRRVGSFDDRFYLNFEDSEWSVRANRHDVELVVACDIRILHSVSASFRGSAAVLGTFYYVRNGLLFNRLIGGSAHSRLRFLRHRALPGLRRAGIRNRFRTLVVTGWAVGAYGLRRFGRAPRPLERLVARWLRATG